MSDKRFIQDLSPLKPPKRFRRQKVELDGVEVDTRWDLMTASPAASSSCSSTTQSPQTPRRPFAESIQVDIDTVNNPDTTDEFEQDVSISDPTTDYISDGLQDDNSQWMSCEKTFPEESLHACDSTDAFEDDLQDNISNWWKHVPCDETSTEENLHACDFSDVLEDGELIEELRNLDDVREFSDQEDTNKSGINDLLFEGSQLTIKESVILLLGIVARHQLTSVALEDILAFVNLVCPKGKKMAKESQELYSYFQKYHTQRMVKHFYCHNKKCQSYIGISLQGITSCDMCGSCLKEEAVFLEIPVQDQLRAVLSVPGAVDKLKYRFSRCKLDTDAIEDVYDGSVYKDLSSNGGFLSNPLHISLLGNTDGVALVRSSKASVWPVYYVINELPPHERFSRSSRLFAGLWFGKGKPHLPTFMKPYCQSLRSLYTDGIEIAQTTIKGILLDTTMDSPARAMWLNFKQFNGYYGCPKCTEPGEQLDLGAGKGHSRRQCHIYPFNKDYTRTTGHALARNHDKVKQQALVAMDQIAKKGKVRAPEEGVMGLSWAFSLPLHDAIAGTAIDYMHCVCEGVVDQHLKAWFEDKSSPVYIGGIIKELDDVFISIKPTSEVTRRPQSLSDWHSWKANEKRAFLLYYAIPLLMDRLNEDCLLHLTFLVGAVNRLLKQSISKTDLTEADVLLKLYCAQAPGIYGKRFQTFNVHLLLHLKETVKELGPLWSYSCFFFEDYNGDFKGYYHGSQNIQGQIIKSVCIHQSLPQLAQSLAEESPAKKLYSHLLSKSRKCRTVGEEVSAGIHVVGALERVWETSTVVTPQERAVLAASKMWTFKRAMINGKEFQSQLYKKTKARNNYTVKFERKGRLQFGSILKFVKYKASCRKAACVASQNCNCALEVRYVAIIGRLAESIQLPHFHGIDVLSHIKEVKETSKIAVITLASIKQKCLRVDAGPHIFIATEPNMYEKD